MTLLFLVMVSATLSSTVSDVCADLASLPDFYEVDEALRSNKEAKQFYLSKERLRMSNSLPTLEVSFGSDVDENFRWSTNRTTTEIQRREFDLRIRARWNLSSLLFDRSELRWQREKRAHYVLQKQQKEEVLARYRRLRELISLPRTPLRAAKIRFLCERLDSETNGLFLRRK
ncbi:MAG: hypothetical protein VYC39_03095 [Myxococcota bacterium]|nr:hypothetical protein [Myxococcota bacterium]